MQEHFKGLLSLCRKPSSTATERKIMNIKFAKGIDVVIENKHIQGLSGVKSNEDDLYLLSMDDGMHYLLDLSDKTIRRYDDFSKISDILKKEDV